MLGMMVGSVALGSGSDFFRGALNDPEWSTMGKKAAAKKPAEVTSLRTELVRAPNGP